MQEIIPIEQDIAKAKVRITRNEKKKAEMEVSCKNLAGVPVFCEGCIVFCSGYFKVACCYSKT